MSYTQMINKYILLSFYCSLLTTTFDTSLPIFLKELKMFSNWQKCTIEHKI